MTKMSSQYVMLELQSDPRNIREIERFVDQIVSRYRLSPDLHGNLLISLTEAVNNAIIHGNRRDKSKKVSIRLKKLKDSIAVSVTDQGRGFDYRSLPDPTAPENLTRIGGRGVFLMRQLSDRISYANNGTTVELQFNI